MIAHRRLVSGVTFAAAVALSAACTQRAAPEGEGTVARVYFSQPQDGSTVSSPVHVVMGAEGLTLEPAGEVKEGHGHLHITVDGACSEAGQVIPKDETHLHYGEGQTEADIELEPGEHSLCLQAGDGAHTALQGLEDRLTIAVTE